MSFREQKEIEQAEREEILGLRKTDDSLPFLEKPFIEKQVGFKFSPLKLEESREKEYWKDYEQVGKEEAYDCWQFIERDNWNFQ